VRGARAESWNVRDLSSAGVVRRDRWDEEFKNKWVFNLFEVRGCVFEVLLIGAVFSS